MMKKDKTAVNNLLDRVMDCATTHLGKYLAEGETITEAVVEEIKDRMGTRKKVVFNVAITTGRSQAGYPYQIFVVVDFFAGTITVME